MMSATVDKKRCDFRILIIDDVIANIDVLCKILSSEGYRLSLANNGEKGLQIAKHAVPDLILLDAWLLHNVQLIRHERWSEIDGENIAEELEGMARSDKCQLINHLAVLLAYLLKWEFQPDKRSSSWR